MPSFPFPLFLFNTYYLSPLFFFVLKLSNTQVHNNQSHNKIKHSSSQDHQTFNTTTRLQILIQFQHSNHMPLICCISIHIFARSCSPQHSSLCSSLMVRASDPIKLRRGVRSVVFIHSFKSLSSVVISLLSCYVPRVTSPRTMHINSAPVLVSVQLVNTRVSLISLKSLCCLFAFS